jgi:hypothetical protein
MTEDSVVCDGPTPQGGEGLDGTDDRSVRRIERPGKRNVKRKNLFSPKELEKKKRLKVVYICPTHSEAVLSALVDFLAASVRTNCC